MSLTTTAYNLFYFCIIFHNSIGVINEFYKKRKKKMKSQYILYIFVLFHADPTTSATDDKHVKSNHLLLSNT